MVEDRLVGIKSREIYEAPAALVIIKAHQELETLTLTKDVLRFKATIEQRYAELTYDGLWFTPLKAALDAFITETQKTVTGAVRLKLYKGNSTIAGRTAPNALYSKDLATYDPNSTFDEAAAAGFITLWGLPARQWAGVNGGVKQSSLTTTSVNCKCSVGPIKPDFAAINRKEIRSRHFSKKCHITVNLRYKQNLWFRVQVVSELRNCSEREFFLSSKASLGQRISL